MHRRIHEAGLYAKVAVVCEGAGIQIQGAKGERDGERRAVTAKALHVPAEISGMLQDRKHSSSIRATDVKLHAAHSCCCCTRAVARPKGGAHHLPL